MVVKNILVLDGSFCDEYGKYNKGDIQINDQINTPPLVKMMVAYVYLLPKKMQSSSIEVDHF